MKPKKAAFIIINIGLILLIIGIIIMNIPVEKKTKTIINPDDYHDEWEYEYKTIIDYPFEEEGYYFFYSGILLSSIGPLT